MKLATLTSWPFTNWIGPGTTDVYESIGTKFREKRGKFSKYS